MKAALLVGINEYIHFPDKKLNGCIADVHKLQELLSYNADGTGNFDCQTIATSPGGILDTKALILNAIKTLFSCNASTVLFYFSGHGTINDDDGYLVTADATHSDMGISMSELHSILESSPIKNKIVILDCCHAGRLGDIKLAQGKTKAFIGNGTTIIASCRAEEFSRENEFTGGVFTSLLADGLRGGAADLMGHITPGSLYSFVDSALGPWEQRPIFKTNVSEFVSLRKAIPPIKLECLRKLCIFFESPTAEYNLSPEFEDTSPSHDDMKVSIFKDLQAMERVGLVVPVSEEHMYYAAMNSSACKLTALGEHYWDLVQKGRLK